MWGRSPRRGTREECVENMFPPEAKDLWMLLHVFCSLQAFSLAVMDKTDAWHTGTSSWVRWSFLQRLQFGAGAGRGGGGQNAVEREAEVIVKHEVWDENLFSHVCHSWLWIPTHTHASHGKVRFYVSPMLFLLWLVNAFSSSHFFSSIDCHRFYESFKYQCQGHRGPVDCSVSL